MNVYFYSLCQRLFSPKEKEKEKKTTTKKTNKKKNKEKKSEAFVFILWTELSM